MTTFEEVLDSFSSQNYQKGVAFEHLVKWWLKNDPFWKLELVPDSIQLWEESDHRWGRDSGIDLTAKDNFGNIWAIQAKNWKESIALPKSEIDKFLSESSTEKISKRLLITTTNDISVNALNAISRQEKPVVVVTRNDMSISNVNWTTNLSEKPKPVAAKKLRAHQEVALKKVVLGFKSANKGQLIMACGTGKTLTAQRISEKLDSKKTLVLLPSILLVQQTLRAWSEDSLVKFRALAVCSDESVGGYDQSFSKTSELSIPVTTKSDVIRNFLDSAENSVIFSTYQSSSKVAEAIKGTKFEFDLVLADEAHRLAGNLDSEYGTVLSEGALPSKKYLFMTATPRIFTTAVRNKAKDFGAELYSMDDPKIFGSVFHTYQFSDAIKDEILCDYQVVVIGVTSEEVSEMVQNREIYSINNKQIDSKIIGAHIGLSKAMKKYEISKVISFHSRVKAAEDFSKNHLIFNQLVNGSNVELVTSSISGQSPAKDRIRILNQLANVENPNQMIVTNARCLTEGIDVPKLDGVAFIDPRSSQVDIVQAVGRAIRRSDGSKDKGTVIIPLLLVESEFNNEGFKKANFAPVWSVLNALRSHDERLSENIDSLRTQLGKSETISSEVLNLILDIPRAFNKDLINNFYVELIRETSQSWFEHYGALKSFIEANDHARPTRDVVTAGGINLGNWVTTQRLRKELLTSTQIDLLESSHPTWSWDAYETDFQKGIQELMRYKEIHGDVSLITQKHESESGFQLGVWVNGVRQSFKKGTLNQSRIDSLESIEGWAWDHLDATWNKMFSNLQNYLNKHGDLEVPKNYISKDGSNLYIWLHTQRGNYKKKKLSSERINKLESLKPFWKWTDDDAWEKCFLEFKKFVDENNTTALASSNPIRGWVQKQRESYAKGKLSNEKIKSLESLHKSWSWEPHNDLWMETYNKYLELLDSNPNKTLAKNSKDLNVKSIGSWLERQRSLKRNGQLSADRIQLLEASNSEFAWEPKDDAWQKNFEDFLLEVKARGTTRMSQKTISKNGLNIGAWLNTQRTLYRKGRLSQDRIKKLENSHPTWSWEPMDDQWEKGFEKVKTYYEVNSKLPATNETELYHWIERHRKKYKLGKLDKTIVDRIESTFPEWKWNS